MKTSILISFLIFKFHLCFTQQVDTNFSVTKRTFESENPPNGFYITGGNFTVFSSSFFIDVSTPDTCLVKVHLLHGDDTLSVIYLDTLIPYKWRFTFNQKHSFYNSGAYWIAVNIDNNVYPEREKHYLKFTPQVLHAYFPILLFGE